MKRPSQANSSKFVILLIDDEEPLLRVNHRGLSTLGYEVLSAVGGKEGLRLLGDHPVDLVILDMLMPGIDGVETLRRIREQAPEQKVMILSGFAEPAQVEAVKALGVLAYLKKPLTLSALASAVREALGGSSDVEPNPA